MFYDRQGNPIEAQAVAGHDQVVAKIEEALRRLQEACDEILSRPEPSD